MSLTKNAGGASHPVGGPVSGPGSTRPQAASATTPAAARPVTSRSLMEKCDIRLARIPETCHLIQSCAVPDPISPRGSAASGPLDLLASPLSPMLGRGAQIEALDAIL